MAANSPGAEPPSSGALTPEEASALRLADELRDRIQRERETAQRLADYLEVSAAEALPASELDSLGPAPGSQPAADPPL